MRPKERLFMNGYNNNQQFQQPQQPVYTAEVMTQKKPVPGFAIASLCCGIASIVFCCLSFLGIICGACGIVFGVLSLKKEAPNGKGMALAGLICGAVGAVLAISLWIVTCACSGCGTCGSSMLYNEMMNEIMRELY